MEIELARKDVDPLETRRFPEIHLISDARVLEERRSGSKNLARDLGPCKDYICCDNQIKLTCRS